GELPRARLDPLGAVAADRIAPAPAGDRLAMPDWAGPVARYVFEHGLPETLQLAAFAVTVATLAGIVLGTALTISFLPSRAIIRLYIEIWRGLPVLVTIFILYFALPGLTGVRLSAFLAAAVGLSLWGSAQIAEATRGAVQSIPREQHAAAEALGFSWLGT